VGPDGRDLPMRLADGRTIERGLLTLTTSAASFVLTGIEERPVPSLNRGFSAPVNLVANIGDKDLRFLAVHDSDPFNRWQAINTLSTRVLVDSAAAIRRGDAALDDPDLTAAVTAVLLDRTLEPAFVAQVISLPSEADIAREIASNVDPDAVLAARHALRRSLSGALFEGLARIYDTLAAVPEPFSTSADAAGRRALKNACLDLLSASGDADAVARCMRQYQSANNMTDRMAALATLSYCAVPERETAIADFYTRHADEPLIVDKWLMLQATIPEHATLDRIKALTKHPAFQMSNPNRVRSLIASFAMANPTQSNRPDGAGYDFLVSAVLELDQRNPQVAARLLSALKSWRVLEPGRRALAQAALRRVAAHASLSPDVGDIVQRALAEG
jgi:aminopeptidase N